MVIVMLAGTMRLDRGGIAAGGWENGRLDNFFSHGVGVLCATHLCRRLKTIVLLELVDER